MTSADYRSNADIMLLFIHCLLVSIEKERANWLLCFSFVVAVCCVSSLRCRGVMIVACPVFLISCRICMFSNIAYKFGQQTIRVNDRSKVFGINDKSSYNAV